MSTSTELVEVAGGELVDLRDQPTALEAITRAVLGGQEKQWGIPWLERVTPAHVADSPFTREDRQNDLVGGYRSETVAESSLILN